MELSKKLSLWSRNYIPAYVTFGYQQILQIMDSNGHDSNLVRPFKTILTNYHKNIENFHFSSKIQMKKNVWKKKKFKNFEKWRSHHLNYRQSEGSRIIFKNYIICRSNGLQQELVRTSLFKLQCSTTNTEWRNFWKLFTARFQEVN